MVRECGAKHVYFASYSPPLRYPCVYGIDMQTRTEFVARDRDAEQIARQIGADKVIYQTLDNLKKAVRMENQEAQAFLRGLLRRKLRHGRRHAGDAEDDREGEEGDPRTPARAEYIVGGSSGGRYRDGTESVSGTPR